MLLETKTYSTTFLGRKLNLVFNFLAEQASAAVVISYGESVLLTTIVVSNKIREGIDYFPLTVDFEERAYAAGRIKKSRFVKREGKPTDEAIVSARMIDRSIRPFFNHRLRNDVQIILTCLSTDNENDLDILGILGASIVSCLAVPDFAGPVAPIRVGYVDNKFVFNPTYQAREKSLFDLVLVTTENNLIPMIEFEGKEIPEKLLLSALKEALVRVRPLLDLQKKIIADAGALRKFEAPKVKLIDKRIQKFTENFLFDKIEKAIYVKEKPERQKKLDILKENFLEEAVLKFHDIEAIKDDLENCFYDFINDVVHKNAILKGIRPDGRKLDEIRPMRAQSGILPRTHGSGLFSRGLTQTLSILTLGGPRDVQLLESMELLGEKRFFHHYNFLPFSTGETSPLRGPGRREIGHGYLAEKSIEPMLPSKDKFPYTLRIVSEILSSNGSTSMASVCSSSLALFDGGVDIGRHIAGISIGLMSDEKMDKYVLLTDIQGPEDHFGDMDFKIAGTVNGINAIQLDVKNKGINLDIIEKALVNGREARKKIIDVLNRAVSQPRKDISVYAPRIEKLKVSPAKIKDLIGPGGKTIQMISHQTKSEIDIEDDGLVYITAIDKKSLEEAKKIIKDITKDYKVGDCIEGEVIRIENYGVFVKINNGIDGLIHVSNMNLGRKPVNLNDIFKIKDRVSAQIIKIDEQNRIGLKLIKTSHGGRT